MKKHSGGKSEEIQELMTAIRNLQDQMKVFEGELQWKYDQQLNTLKELTKQCSYLLYLSVKLCCDRQREEKDAPEGL